MYVIDDYFYYKSLLKNFKMRCKLSINSNDQQDIGELWRSYPVSHRLNVSTKLQSVIYL